MWDLSNICFYSPLKRFGINASKSHSEVAPREWFETYGSNPN